MGPPYLDTSKKALLTLCVGTILPVSLAETGLGIFIAIRARQTVLRTSHRIADVKLLVIDALYSRIRCYNSVRRRNNNVVLRALACSSKGQSPAYALRFCGRRGSSLAEYAFVPRCF